MQHQKQVDQLWQLFLQPTCVDNTQLQRTIKICHQSPIAASQQINTMATHIYMFQMNHPTESTHIANTLSRTKYYHIAKPIYMFPEPYIN
jgi:hypothetical protein